jgi:hypothetical protein
MRGRNRNRGTGPAPRRPAPRATWRVLPRRRALPMPRGPRTRPEASNRPGRSRRSHRRGLPGRPRFAPSPLDAPDEQPSM